MIVVSLNYYTLIKGFIIMSSFRSTVENMSKLMDEMGITELDLERQLLLGLYQNNKPSPRHRLDLFHKAKQH